VTKRLILPCWVLRSQKTKTPAFQTLPDKDEKVVLDRPSPRRQDVSRGTFYGPYDLEANNTGRQLLKPGTDIRAALFTIIRPRWLGFSSGYDWSRKLALLSPAARAQKLLEDYVSKAKPDLMILCFLSLRR